MNTKPYTSIQENYEEIADLCKRTQEPVYLTKNDEKELVVMDIHAFKKREEVLNLREALLSVEEDRMLGSKGFTVKEAVKMMRSTMNVI